MDYSVSHSTLSRRRLLKLFSSSFLFAPSLWIAVPSRAQSSETFRISLEFEDAPGAIWQLPFVIRMENIANTPAPLKWIRIFAPGDTTPQKARFDVVDDRTRYEGRIYLERSQYVMALAELSDGTLVYDRRFAG